MCARRGSACAGAELRTRQPHEPDHHDEDDARDVEDVVGGEHERLAVDQAIEECIPLLVPHALRLERRKRLRGRGAALGEMLDQLRVVESRDQLPGPDVWGLSRRSQATPDKLSYYLAYAPPKTTLETLVRVASNPKQTSE